MEWKLFADLAEAAGGKRVSLDLEPDATVRDALDELVETHPALADRVFDADGELGTHINILHNGENVITETDDGLETPVDPEDELALFPPVSGG